VPRNAGLTFLMACATDPTWLPPSGRNAEFAGVARILSGGQYVSNPTSDPNRQIDAREESYGTRQTALLAKIGGQYGIDTSVWCQYLAHQVTNVWSLHSAAPFGDTTGSAFVPENLFAINSSFPAASVPPITGPYGTSPWRSAGLPSIALSEAYDALQSCGDSTTASLLYNSDGTGLVNGLANFIWNYGLAPDGGTFYAVGYASDASSSEITWNNFASGVGRQSGFVSAQAGSNVVSGGSTNFLRAFWPGASMQINGTNYTVAAVASDTSLTLTTAVSTDFVGSNFGNTCALTVTNGSASGTGSASCKFTHFFAGGNAYVGIISGACYFATNGCTTLDGNTYGVTVNNDTSLTLSHAFLGASGTYTSFVYAPESSRLCGQALASYCNPDPYDGRNLSQDTAAVFGWLYAKNGSPENQKRGDFIMNKIYGGSAFGAGVPGAPTGSVVYSRPGTITASPGSAIIVGSGTQFTAQFRRGSKIVIGDGANGVSWANYPTTNPTFLSYAVANVNDDTHLTLAAPYSGAGAASTAIYYNPADPQWLGADGGVGNLGEILPDCSTGAKPCGGNLFVPKYGKSLGMGSGAGNVPLYLANRVGGSVGATNRNLLVGFDLASVPHATVAIVSVLNPDGSTGATSCSTSPCVVSASAREGLANISIEYHSATGSVLSTSYQMVAVGIQ
jgi:hypothetical protein